MVGVRLSVSWGGQRYRRLPFVVCVSGRGSGSGSGSGRTGLTGSKAFLPPQPASPAEENILP